MNPTVEFERNRAHMRSLAYRMLGSMTEAEDAVQEAWLRFDRAGPEEVDNLRAWLTVIVSRVCLDMLRSRRARREEPFDGALPEPIVTFEDSNDPEHEVLLADSVGLALQVVLGALNPAERLAFVLHDMFGLSFEEIAPIVERTIPATRQLASRARRRVHRAEPSSEANDAERRAVIDAFLAASRNGDFDALVRVLDPGVVMRIDAGRLLAPAELHGPSEVAARVLAEGAPRAPFGRPALVNGVPGVVVVRGGGVSAVAAFTISEGRITSLNVVADPEKLRQVPAGPSTP
jgi:RNA polymerase sigma factor (sigma-70 family)